MMKSMCQDYLSSVGACPQEPLEISNGEGRSQGAKHFALSWRKQSVSEGVLVRHLHFSHWSLSYQGFVSLIEGL